MAQRRSGSKRSTTGSKKTSASRKRTTSSSSSSSKAKSSAKSGAGRAGARKKFSDSAPTRGTAPSAPDIKSLRPFEASDEAKATVPSDVDAMGEDKRREVIGHAYGPSRSSQLLVLGSVIGVTAALLLGGKYWADKSDEPPKTNADKAPWSAPDAPQTPALRPE